MYKNKLISTKWDDDDKCLSGLDASLIAIKSYLYDNKLHESFKRIILSSNDVICSSNS